MALGGAGPSGRQSARVGLDSLGGLGSGWAVGAAWVGGESGSLGGIHLARLAQPKKPAVGPWASLGMARRGPRMAQKAPLAVGRQSGQATGGRRPVGQASGRRQAAGGGARRRQTIARLAGVDCGVEWLVM